MEPGKIGARQVLTAGAAVLLVEWLLYAAASRWPAERMALTGAGRVVQSIATILLAGQAGSSGTASLGLAKDRLLRGTIGGLFWSAGFGALCGLAALVLYAAGIDPLNLLRMRLPGSGAEIFRLFAVGALISPVAEEIFFRGLLYGFFRRWGAASAIFGSTAIFTAAHLSITPFPFTQVIGGLLFAAAYERERSLATPITIHILGNAAIFTSSLWL